MSDLVHPQHNNLAVPPQALGVMKRELSFIPPVKMLQKGSKQVEEGRFPVGHFIYQDKLDLGSETYAWLATYQPAAIEFHSNKLYRKSYIMETQVIDGPDGPQQVIIGDQDFKEISEGKDDRANGITFRWGLEVLFYFPEHRLFGNLFLGTSSAREQAEEFATFLGQPVVLWSEPTHNKKTGDTWLVPRVRAVSGEVPGYLHVPDEHMLEKATAKFRPSPAEGDVEEGDVPDER
jgi:hypothetical protein